MKRIVITGATGLIGKKLVDALIVRGDEVIIFSRDAEKAKAIFPKALGYEEWNYQKPAAVEIKIRKLRCSNSS